MMERGRRMKKKRTKRMRSGWIARGERGKGKVEKGEE